MDGQIPGVIAVPPANPAVPFKDRSVLLVFFGILTMLVGCVAGLFVLMMLGGRAASSSAGNQEVPLSALLPAMVLYAGLAVALNWLGVGSILAKRWARALLLIFSWSWLILGIIACALLALFMPTMLADLSAMEVNGRPALPPEAVVPMIIVVSVMFGGIFLVLPGIWVLVYNGRHLKATCEARNPQPTWTDTCPLPVLGFALWLGLSVPTMLLSAFIGNRVVPFFGVFLTEWKATVFCLAAAASWGYAAWSLYKLKRSGWWVTFIIFCIVLVSGFLTFSQHNFGEMYRLMNYPESQVRAIENLEFLKGNGMHYLMIICMTPFVGYLMYIRKFIFKEA